MKADAANPIIPRAVLFGNPVKAMARLSPNGKMLGFLAPIDGVLNVHVATLSTPVKASDLDAAKVLTHNTTRSVSQYWWAYTNQHILYADDAGGDENFRVYAVDVSTGEKKDLTPVDGVQARIVGLSWKFPDEILIAMNDRDPQYHDIHRVNIRTGERKLVYKNEQWENVIVDDDFKVRLGNKINEDGSQSVEIINADGSTQSFLSFSFEDSANSNVLGFDVEGTTLYITDSTGRDTSALYSIDFSSGKPGEKKLIFKSDQSDVVEVLTHPKTGRIQAVEQERERRKWIVLDQDLPPYWKFVRERHLAGDMFFTSRSLDDQRWVVAFIDSSAPAEVYFFEKGTKKPEIGMTERDRLGRDRKGKTKEDENADDGSPKLTFLYVNQPALAQQPLAPMQSTIIKSRDGLEMVAYYTLPVGSDADSNGKPDKPLPMVLNVHGGPWARDSWGYHSEHQWLANRGYAVLSVNFRGSEGFGKNFLNAGNKQWGATMHNDLLDAVNWAVKEKIADPSRVAIYGGSYGGYAALAGLTFTPDKFACGVSIVGPSNLVTLLESFPAYWKPAMDQMVARVGDHRTPEGREFLLSRSPLTHVDKIMRPLLVGQGANDPRVKKAESDQIVSAVKGKGLPVTYVLYPDEGHGFAREPNRMSFYAVAEAFLAQHLGGRAEPIGDAFKNSTIQVPEGSEQIPGLGEALKANNK